MYPYNLKISRDPLIVMKDMNSKGKTMATVSVFLGNAHGCRPFDGKGYRTDILSCI